MSRRKPSGKRPLREPHADPADRDERGRPSRPECGRPERGRAERGRAERPRPSGSGERQGQDGRYWIYGHHAVMAALANPRRRLIRLLATADAQTEFAGPLAAARARYGDRLAIERASRDEIAAHVGPEAVHQGIAAEALPLPSPELESILAGAEAQSTLLALDQVTDPHNVGAILRSAAAFGAAAVIVTQHHSPPETGSLAKAASGGLEQVPLVRVANLSQALQAMKKAGFWCLGLAAEGAEPLASANLDGRIAFVLGAEGGGLRRLTREQCDLLIKLPTRPGLVQLNVSNAAAIALFERARAMSSVTGEPDQA
jgi:23S rRNA (guanosine2251-2'-O)-methyltransferase